MNIYSNIKEIADHKGLSIRKIELMAGVSNGSIRKWNTVSPSVDNLVKVSTALKVNINRLIR